MAVVTIVLIRMKKYMRVFRQAGATGIPTAIVPEEHGISRSFIFEKLVRKGILVPVNGNRFYMDESKEAAFNSQRRLAVIIILVLILAGIILRFIVV